MEQEKVKMQVSEILVERYGVAEANLVLNITKILCDQLPSSTISINMQVIEEQQKYQAERENYEARKIALEAAVKTHAMTGGDLTENAIKYKRFLLNESTKVQ
jgi:hypothetical protein